jgi:hypothetical protein
MHQEGYACVYDAPAGQPPAPRPQAWVDVHVAVAWHPSANDVWAIWNVRESQGGQAAAEEAVLSDCRKVMGEGCTVPPSVINGTIAIARSPSGLLFYGWGTTPDIAQKSARDSCSSTLACAVAHIFTAKPWIEYTDAPGFNQLKHYRPKSHSIKGRFGTAIMADTDDPRWSAAIWISAVHATSIEAQNAAADKCDADSGTQCKAHVLNMDGVIAIFQDDRGDVGILNEQDDNTARAAVRERCARDRVKCTVMQLVDVKRPGLFIFNPAAMPKQ